MDRKLMRSILEQEESVIEFGPFCSPFVKSDNCKYFDVLDSDGLRERALNIVGGDFKQRINNIPKKIHYVSNTLDFGIIDETFSAAFSSHCIEHQPDLIYHFQQVSKILKKSGSYYLAIPDKRFCFDFFKTETALSDILEAHVLNNRNGKLSKFLDRELLSTHNNPRDHWLGKHGVPRFHLDNIRRLIDSWKGSLENNEYIDIHNLQFTPNSFLLIILSLYYLRYIDLYPIVVTETKENSNEFYAQLKKINISDKQYIKNQIISRIEYGKEKLSTSSKVSTHVKSIGVLIQKAEKGDAVAQFKLGEAYLKGNIVKQDKVESVKWYRKSAEQGYKHGQFRMGTAYLRGDGVKPDKAEAKKWLQKAAAQGNTAAQKILKESF